MRLWLVAFATVLLAPCSAALADTVYLLGNQSGQGSVGNVTINSATGIISGLNATVSVNGASVVFNGTATQQAFNRSLNEYQATFMGAGDFFQLNLPVSTLVGYSPSNNSSCSFLSLFCDYLANVYSGSPTVAGPVNTFEGNLLAQTATGVTPEPSSIALLGTGLLGVAGALRRRVATGT